MTPPTSDPPGAARGAPAPRRRRGRQAASCTRGGATLEQASGNVRVVRRELKTQSAQETRRDGLSATRIEIVDERYVGVVLTGEGGTAFTCGPLWLFRNAAQKTATQVEPAAAGPRSLALAHGSDSFIDRLYWTLGDGTIRSLDLS